MVEIVRGNFQNKSAPAVFVELIAEQATGHWSCQLGRVQKDVWFEAGIPIRADSNQASETLFRLCLQWEIISPEEQSEFLAEAHSKGIRSGEVLRAKKGLSEEELQRLLERQALTRLTELMRWQKGTWFFAAGEQPEQKIAISRLKVLVDSYRIRYNRETLQQLQNNLSPQVYKLQVDQLEKLAAVLVPHPPVLELAELFRSRPLKVKDAIQILAQKMPAGRAWQLFLVCMDLDLLTPELVTVPAPAVSITDPHSRGEAEPKPTVVPHGSIRGAAAVKAQSEVEDSSTDPELEKLYIQWSDLDAFAIFELEKTVNDAEVRKAYFKMAKKYHPDKYYDRTNRRSNRSAEKLFALIGQTYEKIRTTDVRSQYVNFLEAGVTAESAVETARKIMESETAFQKAQILVRRRKYDEAIEQLNNAISLNPEESEYLAALGWVEFIRSWPENQAGCAAGQKKISEAIRLNENAAENYYTLGRIFNIMGDKEKAEKQFRTALDKNPDHKEARRDLGLLKAKQG